MKYEASYLMACEVCYLLKHADVDFLHCFKWLYFTLLLLWVLGFALSSCHHLMYS